MSRIPGTVFSDRIDKLQTRMIKDGVNYTVVYSDIWRANNVAYLTDYRQGGGGIGQSWTALLLPARGRPVLFTGFEETGCAAIQLKIDAEIASSTNFEDILRKKFTQEKTEKIGLIGNPIILHSVYLAIKNAANDATLVDCDLWIAGERWVKTHEEIECIKRAFEISDQAIVHVIDSIREGVSEMELFALGTSFLAQRHCELAFIPTVNIGVNSGIAMKRPSDMRAKKGDIVMLDFGAAFEGYTSDTTRTVGFHVTDSYKRGILTTALEARDAGLAVIKPGGKIADVENAVRNAIKQKGYGDFILHNVGHGLGIDSSEEDLPIGPDSGIVMKKGMVFTVEPGIYVPGVGGCRIEDCVHVTDSGYEIFSSLPPDYFID